MYLDPKMPAPISGERGAYVYVIHRGDDVVKLGFSVDPRRRLASIQSNHELKCTILRTWHFGRERDAKFVERRLHSFWDGMGRRLRGEWFAIDPHEVGRCDEVISALGFAF